MANQIIIYSPTRLFYRGRNLARLFPTGNLSLLPRLFGLWLLIALLFSSNSSLAADHTTRLIIAHTSDIHGFISPRPEPFANDTGERRILGGFAALQSFLIHARQTAQDEDAAFLYLDSGDYFQGTAVVDHHRGSCMIDLLNEVGLAATTIGNHEFDYSFERLIDVIDAANFPVVCANVTLKASGRRPESLTPFHLFNVGEFTVAVVGVLTPGTLAITIPENVASIDILEPTVVANSIALELRENGVDVVILLSHCGIEHDREMAESLFGIDLILGGHSHSYMDEIQYFGPGRIPVSHSGTGLTHVNEIILDLEKQKGIASLSFRQIPLYLDEWPEDPTVKATVASFEAKVADMKVILGTASVDLFAGVIGGDSTLGAWIADAMREASDADVAFVNYGSLRCPIFKGRITVEDMFQLHPFDNTIEILTMTGEQLIDLVERSLSVKFYEIDDASRADFFRLYGLEPRGLRREIDGYGYQIPANLRVNFDPNRPAMTRITSICTENGTPIASATNYRVAVNSYVAAGGDNYKHLRKHQLRQSTEILVRDAIISKIKRDNGISVIPSPRMLNEKLQVTAPLVNSETR